MKALLISILLLPATPQVEEITFTVSSVKRSALPDDFPYQTLDVGFAVLKLKMENLSSEAWTFRPEEVEVFEGGRQETGSGRSLGHCSQAHEVLQRKSTGHLWGRIHGRPSDSSAVGASSHGGTGKKLGHRLSRCGRHPSSRLGTLPSPGGRAGTRGNGGGLSLLEEQEIGREIVGKLSTVPESSVDRDPLKDKNKFEYLLDHEIDNSLNSSVCA